jgi:DNA-binding IclR family transcriptional regulator
MSAPKLELCIGILQILAENGHLGAVTIAAKVKISRNMFERCMKLLVEQEMVSKTESNNFLLKKTKVIGLFI